MSAKNNEFLDAKNTQNTQTSHATWLNYLDDDTRAWLHGGDPIQVSLGIQFAFNVMRMNSERLLPAYLELYQTQTRLPEGRDVSPTTSHLRDGSSYQIGQDGEEYVLAMLREHLHKSIPCRINHIGKISKSGDIQVEALGMNIVVEVKNYKYPVSYDEVEKFVRDMQNKDSNAGVFISLTSPISKIPGPFNVRRENINGSMKTLVFVTSDSADLIIAAVQMAVESAETTRQLMYELYSREKVSEKAQAIENSVSALSSVCVDLNEGNDKINRILRKQYERIADSRSSLRSAVDSLRNELSQDVVITGGDGEETVNKILSRYEISETIRKNVSYVVLKMNSTPANNGPTWKLLKTKATHIPSKCSISFTKNKTEFIYNGVIDQQIMSDVWNNVSNRCRITSTEIAIEITDDSIDYMNRLMNKWPAIFGEKNSERVQLLNMV